MYHHCTPDAIIVNLNLRKHSTQFEEPNFKLGSNLEFKNKVHQGVPWISKFLEFGPNISPSLDTIFFGDVKDEGRQGKLPCCGHFQFNKHFG